MIPSNKTVKHRYKLADTYSQSSAAFNKIVLYKDHWVIFDDKKLELESFIKRANNVNGNILYERFLRQEGTGEISIVFSELEYINQKEDLPVYTKEVLAILDREELIQIGRHYSIDPINKPAHVLAKLILEAQAKRVFSKPKLEIKEEEK